MPLKCESRANTRFLLKTRGREFLESGIAGLMWDMLAACAAIGNRRFWDNRCALLRRRGLALSLVAFTRRRQPGYVHEGQIAAYSLRFSMSSAIWPAKARTRARSFAAHTR